MANDMILMQKEKVRETEERDEVQNCLEVKTLSW